MTAASVALVMSLAHTAAWATPIIYFGDKSSGGSGGGGGVSGGASGGGGIGGSSAMIASSTPTGKTAPTPTAASAQTEPNANATAVGNSGSGGGSALRSTASTSGASTSAASNSNVSTDPLTNFFEDLAVNLNAVDNLGGPSASKLTNAFDAADVINTPEGPISFGAPDSGVTLTAESFPADAAGQVSLPSIENPEPASLILLGTGLLLVARNRILKRRSRDQSHAL